MKKIVWAIILGLICYFVYVEFIKPPSDEVKQVKALESRFATAQGRYLQSLRQMGSLGLDATADTDDAIGAMKAVRKELQELKESLTEEKASSRAEELEAGIREFFEKNDIR